jgi:2-amino-4-hydroxy-6-hydroxymethyldihydropteridine diphosphokinase
VILIGLGSNLPSHEGDSRATILAAISALESGNIRVVNSSHLWKTAPVPISDQPWFVNAVVQIETALSPAALLARLHAVEETFGRQRRTVNAARTLDLDLLDYHGIQQDGPPILPHPRLHERAFVLLPLQDIAPGWVHPVSGKSLAAMLAAIPVDQLAEPDEVAA